MWRTLPQHVAARANLLGDGPRAGIRPAQRREPHKENWSVEHSVQIAHELDKQERAFMAEGGMESEDYLQYMAEDSGNVAADGNFSVQVCCRLSGEQYEQPCRLCATYIIGFMS